MKKLFLTLFTVSSLLVCGIADAGLHGTAWRDSIASYYMGFYNGSLYTSDDGVEWIGTPGLVMYADFNGSYVYWSNPIYVVLIGGFTVGYGTYSINGTSGTLHNASLILFLFVPVFTNYSMSLIATDWTPPTEGAPPLPPPALPGQEPVTE